MTIEQLQQRNEKFQGLATELAEVYSTGELLAFSSALIRSTSKIDASFVNVLKSKNTSDFYSEIESMEEEMDEVIYVLDKLDVATRNKKMVQVNEILKEGFELLSLYSLCCDHVIEKKGKKKDTLEK